MNKSKQEPTDKHFLSYTPAQPAYYNLVLFLMVLAIAVGLSWVFDVHKLLTDTASVYTIECAKRKSLSDSFIIFSNPNNKNQECRKLVFRHRQFRVYPETQRVILRTNEGIYIDMANSDECIVWDEENWYCSSELYGDTRIEDGEYHEALSNVYAYPKYKWVWRWFDTPASNRQGSIF
jgi:hypothetical protein